MKTGLLEAITEICHDRELDRETVMKVVEDALLQAAKKKFAQYENIEVHFDRKKGGISLLYFKAVVESVIDPLNEISLEEARLLDDEIELDDELEYEIAPEEFVGIIAQTMRQTLFQNIKEVERQVIETKYSEKIGQIVHGVVGRVDFHRAYVMLNNNTEAILEYREQIRNETLTPGEHIRALLIDLQPDRRGHQQLHLSRTHPDFLRRLMESEVPEIYDGIIKIMGVARDPGRRAKVAVATSDMDIDPVGACIGMRGSRIQPMVQELSGERIDIIEWSDDIENYIIGALVPASVLSIRVDSEENTAEVIVPDSEVSLAIGKKGQNIRLASNLTKYNITAIGENKLGDGTPDDEDLPPVTTDDAEDSATLEQMEHSTDSASKQSPEENSENTEPATEVSTGVQEEGEGIVSADSGVSAIDAPQEGAEGRLSGTSSS